ncbi:MAG: metallophosphoesterase [Solirubrobacterales bacterium]|nr:metallophosphoesterase [Solirubrobacterales bacterium]
MATNAGRLTGPAGQLFADPAPTPDEVSFQVDNNSEQYYDSPYFERHQDQVQPVPAPRATPPRLDLASLLEADVLAAVSASKRISFHAVGDTGAAKVSSIATEAGVADAMVKDLSAAPATAPAFFFHLGDVVYHFGEGRYYYDQFYEPFRAYDRPIIAIPGNHDGMVFGDAPDTPSTATLVAFLRNFCAASPGPSPDAAGLVRSTMTQPGVYFTLEAPFVSIVGLYTNVLDGPGVLSSQGGRYPLGDEQLHFLASELKRLEQQRTGGDQRAIIVACHHPPASVDAKHGGGTGLSQDLDKAFTEAGVAPDAVLSGHAHLYQRYTRALNDREIPYVVAGSGGFAAERPKGGLPPAPITVGDFTLVRDPIIEFGYLTLTVDMTTERGKLAIRWSGTQGSTDAVTVDLGSGRIVSQQIPG